MIKRTETINTSVDYDSDTEDGLTMHLEITPDKSEVFLTTETMDDQRKIDLFLEWAEKMTVEEMERRLSRKLDFDDVTDDIESIIEDEQYEYSNDEILAGKIIDFLKTNFE